MATLWRREMVRFFRQRNRVIGALATPILFYLVLGFGLNNAFRAEPEGPGYLEYFFPGTVLMIVLFTAMFSTISVIEERREGFLQAGERRLTVGAVHNHVEPHLAGVDHRQVDVGLRQRDADGRRRDAATDPGGIRVRRRIGS